MKIKIRKNEIWRIEENDEETLIGILTDEANALDEKIIQCGSEAVPAIEKFIQDVNSGSFKPRTAVKEFEQIIYKYE